MPYLTIIHGIIIACDFNLWLFFPCTAAISRPIRPLIKKVKQKRGAVSWQYCPAFRAPGLDLPPRSSEARKPPARMLPRVMAAVAGKLAAGIPAEVPHRPPPPQYFPTGGGGLPPTSLPPFPPGRSPASLQLHVAGQVRKRLSDRGGTPTSPHTSHPPYPLFLF